MLKKIEPYKNNKSTAMRNQNVLYFLILQEIKNTHKHKQKKTHTKEKLQYQEIILRNNIEKY